MMQSISHWGMFEDPAEKFWAGSQWTAEQKRKFTRNVNTPIVHLSQEEFNSRFPSYDAKYLHEFY